MRHPTLSVLVLACLALAGCATPEEPAPATHSTSPGVTIVADRPDTTFGEVETGPAVGPDENATTAAPPRLVAGEWWRIRFTSDRIYEETNEVVRVLAEVQPDGYVFGMPHSGWFKEAISYHAPAFGDVGFDLSYATHNERFEPLRFPLVAGATWETTFATSRLVATVESADEHTATIRLDPPPSAPQPTDPFFDALGLGFSAGMRLVYDAREHEVVRFESVLGTWEVVEHGYGFTGWVTIPRAQHTAIDYGQFLPVTPGEPVVARSALVRGGFNRLTLLHVLVPIGPGAYSIRATAPDGEVFATEAIPGSEFTVRFYESASPDGEWRFEDVVAGPGATYSMGIAYHQYDIRLPDGERRSDHSHPVIR